MLPIVICIVVRTVTLTVVRIVAHTVVRTVARTVARTVVRLFLLLPAMLSADDKALYVKAELAQQYSRKEWRHWIDADKDCQDTRQEVLIRDSKKSVTYKTEKNCKVASGLWQCPYSGETFTNPSRLDIDHVIPLKEAHLSGGAVWSRAQKKQYANDLTNPVHLLAVKASANRKKGAKDLAKWLPQKNSCSYLAAWLSIKMAYRLSVDQSEKAAIAQLAPTCPAAKLATFKDIGNSKILTK